jgi:hypothetical protein
MTRYPPSAAAKPLLLCTAYRPCPRLCVLIHYRPRYLHDSRSISARAHVLGSGENLAQTIAHPSRSELTLGDRR